MHPKISISDAERLGVQPLTKVLLDNNGVTSIEISMDQQIQNSELFGQHEGLTSRLKSIFEMYPDGPGIFYELIQVFINFNFLFQLNVDYCF